MQIAHRPTKVLITGNSGTGKTTFYTRYALNNPARLKFVFDYDGEFSHRTRGRAATNPLELAGAATSGWCIFYPGVMFRGRLPEALNFFCDFVFEVSSQAGGQKLLCIDELQKFCGPHFISPELCAVMETGRRAGLDVAMISNAPNAIHNRIRSQMTEVVAFHAFEGRALEYLTKDCGFDGDQVRALPRFHYIARNMDTGGQVRGVTKQ